MQQFLAVSPWDPALVVRAVAELVAPAIGVEAWVLDDTGFPKDGKRSPGVKRQYSGTLGKIGNCQIGVSVHAVGAKGTVPLGWALYLPNRGAQMVGRDRLARDHKQHHPPSLVDRVGLKRVIAGPGDSS
jgi:SRSO17 transposase